MTYEITVEAGSTYHSTTKDLPSMEAAIAWAKDFADDWHRGAEYKIFCVDNEVFEMGAAN